MRKHITRSDAHGKGRKMRRPETAGEGCSMEYVISFLKAPECLAERCPGQATSPMRLRDHFGLRHRDMLVTILEEGSAPHLWCERCGMQVARLWVRTTHLRTEIFQCAERLKRQRGLERVGDQRWRHWTASSCSNDNLGLLFSCEK